MRAEGIVKDVQDVIERERDWLIDLAQRLVRIPSVNPKFGGAPELSREPEVQTLLDGLLREAGFATQQWDVVPGRPNLVADLPGSEERSLILLGHVDVVPTGDVAAWSVDPFGGTLKDGRIFGRAPST